MPSSGKSSSEKVVQQREHGKPEALVVLVGATASGKSEAAFRIAQKCPDVEIISVDSMTVYTEMDIGTAKPSAWERDQVPHHLIDMADPSEEYSVSRFQTDARAAIADVKSRAKIPLLVGGTGLYVRSIVDDLRLPGQFPQVRARLDIELEELGADALYERLRHLDPLAVTRILPGNHRRLIRALEVTEGSGKPFSSFGPGLESYPSNGAIQIGLDLEKSNLDSRIARRVARQMDLGWLEETRHLLKRDRGLSRTARQALGYRELALHIEDGFPLDEATEAIMRRTRAFARRQKSWFKRDPRIEWLPANEIGTAMEKALAKNRAA